MWVPFLCVHRVKHDWYECWHYSPELLEILRYSFALSIIILYTTLFNMFLCRIMSKHVIKYQNVFQIRHKFIIWTIIYKLWSILGTWKRCFTNNINLSEKIIIMSICILKGISVISSGNGIETDFNNIVLKIIYYLVFISFMEELALRAYIGTRIYVLKIKYYL